MTIHANYGLTSEIWTYEISLFENSKSELSKFNERRNQIFDAKKRIFSNKNFVFRSKNWLSQIKLGKQWLKNVEFSPGGKNYFFFAKFTADSFLFDNIWLIFEMIFNLFLSHNIKLYIILTSFQNMQIVKSTQNHFYEKSSRFRNTNSFNKNEFRLQSRFLN